MVIFHSYGSLPEGKLYIKVTNQHHNKHGMGQTLDTSRCFGVGSIQLLMTWGSTSFGNRSCSFRININISISITWTNYSIYSWNTSLFFAMSRRFHWPKQNPGKKSTAQAKTRCCVRKKRCCKRLLRWGPGGDRRFGFNNGHRTVVFSKSWFMIKPPAITSWFRHDLYWYHPVFWIFLRQILVNPSKPSPHDVTFEV